MCFSAVFMPVSSVIKIIVCYVLWRSKSVDSVLVITGFCSLDLSPTDFFPDFVQSETTHQISFSSTFAAMKQS